jgi:ribosomal protein L16/L10AE
VHLKINIVPYVHLTKKPISARMGKGKGKPIK